MTLSRASNKGWEIHNGRTESCFQTSKKSITTLCPGVVLHILTPVVEGKPAPPRYERISAKFLPHLVIGDSLSHDFGTPKIPFSAIILEFVSAPTGVKHASQGDASRFYKRRFARPAAKC